MDHTTSAMSQRTADGMWMVGLILIAFGISVVVVLLGDAIKHHRGKR